MTVQLNGRGEKEEGGGQREVFTMVSGMLYSERLKRRGETRSHDPGTGIILLKENWWGLWSRGKNHMGPIEIVFWVRVKS